MSHNLNVLGVLLLYLFLPVRPASAQSDIPPSGLRIPTIVWASGVAADWITTYRFSDQYANVLHETNPLIRGLDHHPVWLVTAGASLDAATWWAANRFLGARHPRLLKTALYGAAAYRGYLAVYNSRMIHEARATQAAAATGATGVAP